MNNVKLSVTIELQGRTMMTSQECDKNPRERYEHSVLTIPVKRFDKKTKKVFYKKESFNIYTRKYIPAQQVINMSDEAYQDMISSNCPDWFTGQGGPNRWKKLSLKEKLEAHLQRLCESLKGTSFEYVVFDD